MRDQSGEGHAQLKQIRRQRLLPFVTTAASIRPVEHVGGKANVAAPSQLIAEETPTVILLRPVLGGAEFLRFLVPWLNHFFFADVEFRAVVVQQENRREWPLAFGDSH